MELVALCEFPSEERDDFLGLYFHFYVCLQLVHLFQLPKHDDPLYELTKKYNDKWAASLERLLNNPSIPMSTCVRLSKSIDEEIQDLRQAQALQKERVRYKNLIDEKLANGYEVSVHSK